MVMSRWQASFVDAFGNLIDQPTIQVKRKVAGEPLQPLYWGPIGTEIGPNGSALRGNPFTAGIGEDPVFFHCTGGVYKITAAKGPWVKTWDYVNIGTAAATDYPPLASGGIWNLETTYPINTYVRHNDIVYLSKAPSTGIEPGVTEGWQDYWDIFVSAGVTGRRNIAIDAKEDFAAVGDGVADDTAEIQNAIDYARDAGGGRVLLLGTFLVSDTLIVHRKCSLFSHGFGRGRLTRVGDYGDTIQLGENSPGLNAQDCEVFGLEIRHQHTVTPGVTTVLDNPVTAGSAHIRVIDGQDVRIHDNWFYYMPRGVVLDGGFKVAVRDNYFYGIWDHAVSGLQEGEAFISVLRDLSSIIPTSIIIDGNFFSGPVSAARSCDWGAGSPVTIAENIGTQDAIYLETVEHCKITNNYAGAMNRSIIHFNPDTIVADVGICNNEFDAARQVQILFDVPSVAAANVTIVGNTFKGAAVGAHAIVAINDGAAPSVRDLTVLGNQFSLHVKTPIRLLGAIGFAIVGNTFAGYNAAGLTYVDTAFCAGVQLIGAGLGCCTAHGTVGDNIFGGGAYAPAASADNKVQYGVITQGTGTTSDIGVSNNRGEVRTGGTLVAGDVPDAASRSDPTGIAEGRLTLTTGTPVMTSNVVGATTLYYTPYIGNNISLWGAGKWTRYAFSELSLSLAGATANTLYDIFIYDNAGTLTLERVAWTNDSTRATALVRQDGVLVKTGALDRRWLGTVRINGTGGQIDWHLGGSAAGGTPALLTVQNFYNRRRFIAEVKEATASWAYASATLRSLNNSNGNRCSFVNGLAEDAVLGIASYNVSYSGSTAGNIAIGLDATNAASGIYHEDSGIPSGGSFGLDVARCRTNAIGWHFMQVLEMSRAGSTTFYGAIASPNTAGGLMVDWWG